MLDQQRRVIYSVRRKALLDSDEEVLGSLKSFCEAGDFGRRRDWLGVEVDEASAETQPTT